MAKNFYKLILFFMFFMIYLMQTKLYSEEVIMGISSYPPYVIIKDNYVSGINIDLFSKIAKELGYEIKYIQAPWRRLLLLMEKGEIDILGTASKSPERQKYMHYIEPPYMYGKKIFYLRKNRNLYITEYVDLHELKIGMIRGSKHYTQFDSDSKINKVYVSDEKLHMKMLMADRIDAFIGSETIMDFLIQKYAYTGKFRKSKYFYAGSPGYFTISKKSKILLDTKKIDKLVKKLLAKGDVKKIIQKYIKGKNVIKYKIK